MSAMMPECHAPNTGDKFRHSRFQILDRIAGARSGVLLGVTRGRRDAIYGQIVRIVAQFDRLLLSFL